MPAEKTQLSNIKSSQPDDLRIDPLYLFACGLSWGRHSNTSAGWELVRCLRSSGQAARIAAALLAQAENKPVRTLMRAIDDPGNPPCRAKRDYRRQQGGGYDEYSVWTGDYGELCELQAAKGQVVLWPSPNVLKSFSAASHLSIYPGSAILFVEGQTPRGVLVLCSGKVKLSTTSRDGKVLILKMAEPGEALGLSAVISGTPYEMTAKRWGHAR